jgi:hypothetical protein
MSSRSIRVSVFLNVVECHYTRFFVARKELLHRFLRYGLNTTNRFQNRAAVVVATESMVLLTITGGDAATIAVDDGTGRTERVFLRGLLDLCCAEARVIEGSMVRRLGRRRNPSAP